MATKRTESYPRELAMAGPPGAKDRSSTRRANLSLILNLLHGEGGRSRARIAADTGLPKATVTNLIAELVEGGLVREGEAEREGAIGRPGHVVELDGRSLCGIGAEINVDYVSVTALNLPGDVVAQRRLSVKVAATPPEEVLGTVAGLVSETIEELGRQGVRTVGVTLAAPGVIDPEPGVVSYASNIGWREVSAVDGLRRGLGAAAPEIHLENDAKLGAIAEFVTAATPGVRDLVYLTGATGVGAGIIASGKLLRGNAGFAGEVGHLPLGDPEQPCPCGRRGCWETAVGLAALLRLAADPDDVVHDPSTDLESRLRELRRRADDGDPRTLAAVQRLGDALRSGVALLVDILNPRLLVLGGHFAVFGDYLLPAIRDYVHETVIAPNAGGCELVPSELGFTAPARGGAYLSLDAVYQDPIAIMQGLQAAG
ncbi:ROK family transcriptional regulator [Streptacidiphilus anmyonensis]|uniref:ROK family transcriptional regulator n=1 Tax=Streptacidiphilus anmyonensis TaxID=405782 RepID=UPI000B29A12E|nr:ROK family protein [Streptacidiphilus anmyonensis]